MLFTCNVDEMQETLVRAIADPSSPALLEQAWAFEGSVVLRQVEREREI